MNYTLHQLRIFTKVCENKSVTKASEELYLTQPAISIQLKKFQNAFEIPLTEVVGRQLYVTDFGKEIYQLAIDILDKVDLIEAATDEYKGILTGRLEIAVVSTGKYVMPYFLTGFMRKHPGVTITIDVTNKTKVVENLQANTIDFALVSVIPQNLSLERIPLMNNELYLVSPRNYLGNNKKITLRNLHLQTLIFREHGSATRNAMVNYLNDHQIKVNRSIELVSNEAVKQAVKAGLGLSIMPLIGIRSTLKMENLKIIPIDGLPITTEWNLVYGKGKNLSPAAKALVKYIELNKAAIIEEHFKK